MTTNELFRWIARVCIALAVAGFFMVFYVTADRIYNAEVSTTPDSVDTFAADVAAWQSFAVTNTPEPSATPQATHTPYPTFTHTAVSTVVENEIFPEENNNVVIVKEKEPQIVYVDRELEVTRIVTVLVTATPEPKTATPEPTVNLTQEYGLIAVSAAKRHNIGWWVALVFGAIASAPFVIWFSGAMFLAAKEALFPRPTVEDTTQTADEIKEQAPINDLRRDRWIIKKYEQGFSKNRIQQLLFGYTGGTAYDVVNSVIEKHEGKLLEEESEGE